MKIGYKISSSVEREYVVLNFYLSMLDSEEHCDKIKYIYERYTGIMKYCAGKILSDRNDDVEDAVHNAMLRIIKVVDRVDVSDERKLRSFCTTVAQNAAVDILRQRDNQNLYIEDVIYDDNEDEYDIFEQFNVRDVYKKVIAMMDKLSDTQKSVMILKYVHDIPDKEIAVLLNISTNAVDVRVSRGKKKLMAMLKEENVNA